MPASNELQVFLATPANLLQAAGAEAAAAILDDTDRAHVARFRFERDRDIALASRALQRLAIAHSTGRPDLAPQLCFTDAPGQRPRLAGPEDVGEVAFSAANTRGLVACAVSRSSLVGMDVEEMKPALAPELVEHCCTAAEKDALERLGQAGRVRGFFRLWALKESYLKARGVGLQLSPHRIGFDAASDGQRFHLHTDAAVEAHPESWHFQVIDAGPDHAAAVCDFSAAGDRPVVTVWRVDWDGGQFRISLPA